MSKLKRIVIVLVVLGILSGAIVTVILPAYRPAMPSEWSQIRSAMSREDFLTILPDDVIDMRKLKGFDVTTHQVKMLGFPCFWQLEITYDRSGRVATAEARFIHQSCGLFNTKPKSILSPMQLSESSKRVSAHVTLPPGRQLSLPGW